MTTATHGGITDIDYGAMIRSLNEIHYAGETSFYGTAPLRPCEVALYQRLPAGARILDVGCGAGRVTRAITDAGGTIVGIDVNQAALDAAKNACPQGDFRHGSMTDLPFHAHRFDAVWCLRFSFNALPTEAERLETLRELWRVCAPGGTVLIEAFNWHYAGRFGLVRLANILQTISRAARRAPRGGTGRAASAHHRYPPATSSTWPTRHTRRRPATRTSPLPASCTTWQLSAGYATTAS